MTADLGKTEAPTARRARSSGWRDPRLWIGVALVAGSVLVGARLLGAADDMTRVWATSSDLARGQAVEQSDLVERRIRFADRVDEDRYLLVGDELPDGAVLLRDVGAGELLPVSALGSEQERLVELPLSTPAENIPSTLTRGSRVDVYVIPERNAGPSAGSAPVATMVLDDVVVIAVPDSSDLVGSVGNRQVLVGVPASAEDRIGTVLAAARDNRLRITRQG